MRTRRRRPTRTPEVNLVPMMDVLMTVLIFFVLISMGLTGVQISGVRLPQSVEGADKTIPDKSEEVQPLVIGLTGEKALILAGEPVDVSALAPAIQAYFAENPDGSLMLKADRALPYEDIAELLSELRNMGGRRVSLAVE